MLEEPRYSAAAPKSLLRDLAERSLKEFLAMAGEFFAALAVMRAEREDAEAFRSIFAAALRRLEGLREPEPVRWRDLVWFVLSFGLLRRPSKEHEPLRAAARDSQVEAAHREEVRRMSETIAQTWEQELLARGQLRACREDLRILLEERFGPLPETVVQQIEATEDLGRLREAIRQVVHLPSLSDLDF